VVSDQVIAVGHAMRSEAESPIRKEADV